MDYSPYYYVYEKGEEPKTSDTVACAPHAEGRKRRFDVMGVIAVLLIILPVIAALIFSDTLTGGNVRAAFKEVFGGGKSTFYLVARGAYDSERDARAHATVTRQAGGAGYIYCNDGQYFVVLATYFSKKEAKSVADKNDGTIIVELTSTASKRYSSTDKKLCKQVVEYAVQAAEELSECASALDSRALGTAEAFAVCAKIRDEAYEYKSRILDELVGTEREEALSVIEPLFGGTEAVTTLSDEATLVPAMRYVVCSAVVALCAF